MEEPVVSTGMDAIVGAVSDVTDVVGTVFSAMTSNPYITVLFAASLLGLGIGVFRRLRSAAR